MSRSRDSKGSAAAGSFDEVISRAGDVLGVIERSAAEIDPEGPHVEQTAEALLASCERLRKLLGEARAASRMSVAVPSRESAMPREAEAASARPGIGVPRGDHPAQVSQDAALQLARGIDADLVLVVKTRGEGDPFEQLGRAGSHPRHDQPERAQETLDASRAIIENARSRKQPELVVDAWNDPRYQRRRSVTSQNIRSVMAAPMLNRQGVVFGVVYADRRGIACRPFSGREQRSFEEFVADTTELLLAARDLARSLPDTSADAETRLRATRKILGDAEPIEKARQLASAYATTHAPVLITGERGTGKELFARAIHDMSPWHAGRLVRLQGPFLVGDTGNAEIRGWRKGAFTGAIESQPGAFEQAADGTLFIDEVADLDPKAQAALLVALDPGVVRRMGETEPRRVTARVIAATNRDLHGLAAEGLFRRDLLDRLSALELRLPPLRERRADLLLLFRQFMASTDLPLQSRPGALSEEAERWLMSHPLEGNVRELKNLATRSCVLAAFRDSPVIEPVDLIDPAKPSPLLPWPQFRRTMLDPLSGAERERELAAWLDAWHRETQGSRKATCEQGCLSDTRLRTLIKEAGKGTGWVG